MEILTAEERAGREKRPWSKWLRNGQTVRLIQGEDFTCLAGSIRQQAYNRARTLGGKVSVSIGVHPQTQKVCVELTFQAATPREIDADDSDTLWPDPQLEAAQSPSPK